MDNQVKVLLTASVEASNDLLKLLYIKAGLTKEQRESIVELINLNEMSLAVAGMKEESEVANG